ncbi:MAG: hypothetical protein KDA91_01670 [Planctomycetaceae bacterium]|nr:hypothetical protein [Planctomycetaceae bacterium]
MTFFIALALSEFRRKLDFTPPHLRQIECVTDGEKKFGEFPGGFFVVMGWSPKNRVFFEAEFDRPRCKRGSLHFGWALQSAIRGVFEE